MLFACPYLGGDVELTSERERHIRERHPNLLPSNLALVEETLKDPDAVRISARSKAARPFTRWYSGVGGGSYAVVVVVSDDTAPIRHWIITAYLTTRLTAMETEWARP